MRVTKFSMWMVLKNASLSQFLIFLKIGISNVRASLKIFVRLCNDQVLAYFSPDNLKKEKVNIFEFHVQHRHIFNARTQTKITFANEMNMNKCQE